MCLLFVSTILYVCCCTVKVISQLIFYNVKLLFSWRKVDDQQTKVDDLSELLSDHDLPQGIPRQACHVKFHVLWMLYHMLNSNHAFWRLVVHTMVPLVCCVLYAHKEIMLTKCPWLLDVSSIAWAITSWFQQIWFELVMPKCCGTYLTYDVLFSVYVVLSLRLSLLHVVVLSFLRILHQLFALCAWSARWTTQQLSSEYYNTIYI